MLLALNAGFVLRRWTMAKQYSAFYHWIDCNVVDKFPTEDESWLQYKLLAIRNMKFTATERKGRRPVPRYTLAYRNINNVVMEPLSIRNIVGIFKLPTPPPGRCKCGNIRDSFRATNNRWNSECSQCKVQNDNY